MVTKEYIEEWVKKNGIYAETPPEIKQFLHETLTVPMELLLNEWDNLGQPTDEN